MCGICGIGGPLASAERVEAMLGQMSHRAPDGHGQWQGESWILGHGRLAIVDLTDAGRQPMQTADGRFICVVNGEIYNYPALRRELEAMGAKFRSDSDSEVVLHAYRIWGIDAFSRLSGMFAFALLDTSDGRLFLVRDRLGIKPLYFVEYAGNLAFASELKALLAGIPEKKWSIDAAGLNQYLRFQNLLDGRSLFSDARSLRPGHYLEVRQGQFSEHAYWTPRFSDTDISFDEAVARFREVFARSIERHLMSDVPVASYLSAGFDSTMVASRAAHSLGTPPAVFTGRFQEGDWYDEVSGARLVAERINAPLTDVAIGAEDFAASIDDVIWALDEPRMGVGALPQYLVAREAARHGKVILTGHGGDELFSGYPVFKIAQLSDRLTERSWSGAYNSLASARLSEIPPLAYFGLQALRTGVKQPFLPTLFSDAMQQDVLQPHLWAAVRAERSVSALHTIAANARSAYERVLLTYLQVYLPGLLVVEDKISMAHSLESRTPFLDDEMVQLSLALPASVKLHGGQLKAVTKEAAKGVLPDALFHMPKRGFPTPLAAWLRGPLAGWATQRLNRPDSPLRRIFRPDFLRRQTAGYFTSYGRAWRPLDEIPTQRMWMLLSLESWLRQHEERFGITLDVR